MAQKLSWDDADPTSFEGVPTTFWADLLDLIGTGNADQIDVFTEIAWPHAKAGKERFLASFREQLRKSPYIADLRSLNGAALLSRSVARLLARTSTRCPFMKAAPRSPAQAPRAIWPNVKGSAIGCARADDGIRVTERP